MDETMQRKRLGRPRKNSVVVTHRPRSPVALVEAAVDDESNDIVINDTSIDAGVVSEMPGFLAVSPTPECRRSARKKIIKFDVRDLLNKNRKAHKIQIEARIDSNAPPTTTLSKPTDLTKLSNVQRPMPLTSRRYSMFVRPTKDPEMLVMQQKPTNSLILAQVANTSTARVSDDLELAVKKSSTSKSTVDKIFGDLPMPKKRGRPRKIKLNSINISTSFDESRLKSTNDEENDEVIDEDTDTNSCVYKEPDVLDAASMENHPCKNFYVALKRLPISAIESSPCLVTIESPTAHAEVTRSEDLECVQNNEDINADKTKAEQVSNDSDGSTTGSYLANKKESNDENVNDFDDFSNYCIKTEEISSYTFTIDDVNTDDSLGNSSPPVVIQKDSSTECQPYESDIESMPQAIKNDLEDKIDDNNLVITDDSNARNSLESPAQLKGVASSTYEESLSLDGNLSESTTSSSTTMSSQQRVRRSRRKSVFCSSLASKGTLEEQYAQINEVSSKEALSKTEVVDSVCEISSGTDSKQSQTEVFSIAEDCLTVDEKYCKPLNVQIQDESKEDKHQSLIKVDNNINSQGERQEQFVNKSLTHNAEICEPIAEDVKHLNEQLEKSFDPLSANDSITLPEVDNTDLPAIKLAQLTECQPQQSATSIDSPNICEDQRVSDVNNTQSAEVNITSNESSRKLDLQKIEANNTFSSIEDSSLLDLKRHLQLGSNKCVSMNLRRHSIQTNDSSLNTNANCEDLSLQNETKRRYSMHSNQPNQDIIPKKSIVTTELVETSKKVEIEKHTEIKSSTSIPSFEKMFDHEAKNLNQIDETMYDKNIVDKINVETVQKIVVNPIEKAAPEEIELSKLLSFGTSTNINVETNLDGTVMSETQEECSVSSDMTVKNRSASTTPIPETMIKEDNSSRTATLPRIIMSEESISSTPESSESTLSGSSNKETDSIDSFSLTLDSNKFSNKRQRKRKTKEIEPSAIRGVTASPALVDVSKTDRLHASTPAIVSEDDTLDPLKDIEKFIEDGVNLLKRDYKLDDDSVDNELSTSVTTKTNLNQDMNAEFAERVRNLETPADSPETVISMSSPTSPLAPSPVPSILSTDEVVSGVRRSHRIKQKPQAPKALVGRGVVRDGECTLPYSVDEQLIELAQIEAINEKFLKTERLNFHMIRENIYKCTRMVSKETVDMLCECFLTAEEEANGQWGCGEGCINRMLMIECGPQCSNRERCTNNRFQKQLCSPCRVFRTEKKGCGIVAEVQILPGDFVMEYVGEVIDSEEFERRQYLYSKDKNRHYYFMALRPDAIIDATVKGNISRFINHSCDPNAETQKWTVNGELRIGFFSRKTIMPGEEITFDYQYQRYGRDAQPCFCEASNCRGWIGEKPASDDDDDSDSEQDIEGESSGEEESSVEGSEDDSRKPGVVREKKSKSRKIATGEDDGKLKVGRTPGKPRIKKRKQDQQKAANHLRDKDREGKDPKLSRAAAIRKAERRTEKERRMRFLEDPDVEEEVTKLSRSGLKNQANTLRLSRLMVRAKLVQTRLSLLGILQRGEVPCRRLFLDYHGLRLLHGWMNENGNEIEFRRALLEVLESLPIPNKTMLTDSKIYQTVKNWNTTELTKTQPQQQTQTLPSNIAPSEEQLKEEIVSQPSASESDIVQKRVDSLIIKWDGLPEIFRIPKRERIEQMKEHEREANRHTDATALVDNLTVTPLESDRYKRDRFGRDTSSRYVKPSAANGSSVASPITIVKDSRHTSSSNGSSGTSYKSETRRRTEGTSPASLYERNKYLPKELRREMFERKVARDEAEKRMAEERRIFEIKCHFFGLDPLSCDPQLMPTSENIETGEFFNIDGLPVPPPPRCGDPPPAPPMQLTDPALYELPEAIKHLPPTWTFAITPDGFIYYINLIERIAQWEPPTEEQIKNTEDLDSESDTDTQSDDSLGDTMVDIDGEYAASLKPDQLKEYIKEKIKERRQKRYERLVSVREISPRRDEDRVYNQIEARKYKENKEKIRRRKEVYRRRRMEIGAHPVAKGVVKTSDESEPYTTLPIQDYLYSSDEESEIEECNNSPLIDVIVQEDKIVDEVDALNSRRHLKRPLPLPPLNMEPSTSKAAASKLRSLPLPQVSFEAKDGINEPTTTPNVLPKRQQQQQLQTLVPLALSQDTIVVAATGDEERSDHKRRRMERDKKRAGSNISSSVKDKFRSDVARIIVEYLKPYRKESCQRGRITNDQDFNHLARRLTHYIMTKEMKYCDLVGQTLVVNDSVRHKSREYIKLYMQKYGRIYKRPENAPEFKEIKIPTLH